VAVAVPGPGKRTFKNDGNITSWCGSIKAGRRVPQARCFGMFTWSFSPCRTTDARTARPASLNITGPSQCPRIDKPRPASIAGTVTLPAVAGRHGKVVAQAVWNCSRAAYWYNRQFTKDAFNWYDVSNLFPVVELIYDSRTNRIQPT
jgi:hypothetical protein